MRLLLLSWFIGASSLFANLDPISLELSVSAVYVSKSVTCSSPIQLFTKDYVQFYDAFGFPVLGISDNNNKTLNGVYPCIIIKMKETLKFVPSQTSGNCDTGYFYNSDICLDGHQNKQLDGTANNCSTTNTGETVYLYLSTGAGSYFPAQPFSPPTQSGDAINGVKIDTPFYVTGPSSGRFVVDGTSRVTGTTGICALPMPRFSFVNE